MHFHSSLPHESRFLKYLLARKEERLASKENTFHAQSIPRVWAKDDQGKGASWANMYSIPPSPFVFQFFFCWNGICCNNWEQYDAQPTHQLLVKHIPGPP